METFTIQLHLMEQADQINARPFRPTPSVAFALFSEGGGQSFIGSRDSDCPSTLVGPLTRTGAWVRRAEESAEIPFPPSASAGSGSRFVQAWQQSGVRVVASPAALLLPVFTTIPSYPISWESDVVRGATWEEDQC